MRFLPVAALVAMVWCDTSNRTLIEKLLNTHISQSRGKVSIKWRFYRGFLQKVVRVRFPLRNRFCPRPYQCFPSSCTPTTGQLVMSTPAPRIESPFRASKASFALAKENYLKSEQ